MCCTPEDDVTNVTVLVGSHDRYSAAWAPFCHGMRKYWPDCPWPVKFVTNRLTAPCGGSLKVGGDRDFSGNVRNALKLVRAPIIFWMLEEYWLCESPNTDAIKSFVNVILRGNVDAIRLISHWSGEVCSDGTYESDPRLLYFAKESAYRTAAQATLWRRETFFNLLRVGESIWEFENEGNLRSRPYTFLGVTEHKYIRYVLNTKDGTYKSPYQTSAIKKGKWSSAARKYARREGLTIDFSRNPDGTKGAS